MAEPPAGDGPGGVTALLRNAAQGDRGALDRLFPMVYAELSRIAHARLRLERAGHTLNTTALVHEAYLRLVDQSRSAWNDRQHFFAVASEAMRRILIDYAKRRRAGKRGSGAAHLPIEAADEHASDTPLPDERIDDLIELDAALERLAAFNAQGARIVQYRFFGGLSNPEVAEVLGTSERTVRRGWNASRAWLARELGDARVRGTATLLGGDAGG